MTRDLHEIKRGIAQARAALDLMEKFIGELESRMVNILPVEDVQFYKATDDDIITGPGLGELTSMNEAIRNTADSMVAADRP